MTAQISDKYFYSGQEYNVVALSKSIDFNPVDYGLEPQASSTACWRGYWCDYEIENDELFLKRLFLYNGEGKYPDLNGVPVSPIEYEEATFSSLEKGTYRKTIPTNFGHRLYEANMKMNYTGKIILGNGFIRDYYIHMGFQRAWAYEELKEFVFQEGYLQKAIDHSNYAKELRNLIDRDPEAFEEMLHSNVVDFVHDSFSLDMKSKAWWIDTSL